MQTSQLLQELAHGRHLQLTHNHRSDPRLFNFYSRIDVFNDSVLTWTEAAVEQFPVTRRTPETQLVISHRDRMTINAAMNSSTTPGCVLVAAPAHCSARNAPQDMYIAPGARLLGAGGCCLKGVFYWVKAVDNKHVTLTDGQQLDLQRAARCLRLSHAITYASCQGLTLHGVLRLYTNGAFTCRHLYVGASRATSADLLEVQPSSAKYDPWN